jgi:hypothetical protein
MHKVPYVCPVFSMWFEYPELLLLFLMACIFLHITDNTNAQHWYQHDPEFYGILLNFIKFYEFYGPPDSLL